MTASVDEALSGSLPAVSFRTYSPAAEKVAVVTRSSAFSKATLPGPDCLLQAMAGLSPSGLQRLHFARQVGLASQHDRAIDARRDHRRKLGRFARVVDLPLQDAGGELAVGIDLQLELGRVDFIEGRGVVLILRHAQARGILDRDEGVAIPVQQPGGLGSMDASAVGPPVDVDLAPC